MEQEPLAGYAARPNALTSPSGLHLGAGVIVAGLLAVAAGLRFALLGQNSLWFDEAFVAWVTQFRWQDIPFVLRATDAHPPLYYLLMKAWVDVAGTGETALRIPSACLGVLSVPLTYALMRRTSSEAASLLGAFLVSVAPFAVMADQEARMYPLLAVLALGSTLALAASVERGGAGRWAVYAALAALTAYTQYLGVLVLLAHGVWVAGYERRHLAAWLAGMAAATLLYAPWVPSLWHQMVDTHGWAWYRTPVTLGNLGDLLGLFAFGGSLLGTTSYFFPGTAGAVGQSIILLPFAILLGRGVLSFRADPRGLALLGLPAAVTIGVTFVASVANLMVFYPRWFSFLLPFYAMVLARGVFDVAEWARGWRERILALLAAGLLLCGVPVLDRYYFDPGFRPYRWRAAAALVSKLAHPGDFLLYVNGAAEIAFTYYFHDPHPSLTLTPIEADAGTGHQPEFTVAEARQMAARYPRVWLISTVPFKMPMQERLRLTLESAYRVVGVGDFTAVWVHLLEAKPPHPR